MAPCENNTVAQLLHIRPAVSPLRSAEADGRREKLLFTGAVYLDAIIRWRSEGSWEDCGQMLFPLFACDYLTLLLLRTITSCLSFCMSGHSVIAPALSVAGSLDQMPQQSQESNFVNTFVEIGAPSSQKNPATWFKCPLLPSPALALGSMMSAKWLVICSRDV